MNQNYLIMRRLVFVILLPFFLLGGLLAQAPLKINYQAVARYSDGKIIQNESISMRISIRKGGVEGQSVYTEIHQLMTNDFGLINLAIGTGDSDQNFAAIEWGLIGGLWVRIEFDPAGGTDFQFMGGMEFLSVPYSFYSSEAGSAPPVLQLLNDSQRLALENPAVGLMILNTTSSKVNVYMTDGWYELGGEKLSDSFSCGQFLLDPRDENTYKTIMIGEQCWMAENLNLGVLIEGGVDMSDNDTIEKYCYQNTPSLCETYGALYQWDELMLYSKTESSRGICPEGWHIPSDMEVQELEIALGMDPATAALNNIWRGSNQGTQMAPGGSSGYDALYAGRRVTGGLFSAIGSYEYFWTSSESGGNAWRRCLRADDTRIGRYNTFPKTYGMSVRCIQDK